MGVWSVVGALALAPVAAAAPSVFTHRGCYTVGQSVKVTGSGFAASRQFDIAIDGVDFGQSTTGPRGGFTASLVPGGLGAGIVQGVDTLDATDGTSSADATFTVTRPLGARFLAASGNPNTARSRFQVWGFGMDGVSRTAYLHYVAPNGRLAKTVKLGQTGGQCGYLLTRSIRVFPVPISRGTWTLQVDSVKRYTKRPGGPVYRIRITIG